MEIASQGDFALRRRNVLAVFNTLPFTLSDTVLTVKIHASDHGRHRLHTVTVVEPQKESGKQKQEQNASNSQI
jgi:hypothetical protein